MKLNKIMLMFCLCLPISIGLRFLQLYFTIDAKTGFFITDTGNFGQLLLILIFFCVLVVTLFSLLVFKHPENPPKINGFISVSSCFLAVAILCELLFHHMPNSVVPWQMSLLKIFGIAMFVYFLLYALLPIWKRQLPEIASLVPVIYLIIKMICDFTTISKLALISDNIILIAAYCFVLLFFLNYAKLYNGTDSDRGFKKLISTGLASVVLCFTNSIPNILINVVTEKSYLHTSMYTNISVLFFGVFILCFLLSYISNKNA